MLRVQQAGCLEVMEAAVMGSWVPGISTTSRILVPFQIYQGPEDKGLSDSRKLCC